eukprot:scaffold101816_cov29-Tisochrysis_lutea.AAC.2
MRAGGACLNPADIIYLKGEKWCLSRSSQAHPVARSLTTHRCLNRLFSTSQGGVKGYTHEGCPRAGPSHTRAT